MGLNYHKREGDEKWGLVVAVPVWTVTQVNNYLAMQYKVFTDLQTKLRDHLTDEESG